MLSSAKRPTSKQLLAHIAQLDPATEEFMGALRDLRAAVLSHADHEEEQVVPMLLTLDRGTHLSLLGQKFRGRNWGRLRTRIRTFPIPRWGTRSSGRSCPSSIACATPPERTGGCFPP